ncbi:cytochrome c biogenesis CcdA family protein [soil metagenome]
MNVSIGIAFLYGILSFLSPCVLPLVPSYLCFVTGSSLDDLIARKERTGRRILLPALAFILGFTTVFVLLGATASAAGQFLREHLFILSKIAGLFIIVMGLHFLGVFRIGVLDREIRYSGATRPAGIIGAYGVGLAFAFGWTPCIGPVLGSIMAIAASEESVARGMGLLAIYSLGLGVPFLLAALMVGSFLGFMKGFQPYLPFVEKIMGALLVVTGLMFITGAMQVLSYWLLELFPGLINLT